MLVRFVLVIFAKNWMANICSNSVFTHRNSQNNGQLKGSTKLSKFDPRMLDVTVIVFPAPKHIVGMVLSFSEMKTELIGVPGLRPDNVI